MPRRMLFRSLALLAMALASPFCVAAPPAENTLSRAEKRAGWQLLFDGRTLNGWKATGSQAGWAVEDGAIACIVRGGGYLYTVERWADFSLRCDFRIDPDVNSGLFLRWEDLANPVQTGMEIQILDSHGVEKPGKHDCGALYDCAAPLVNAALPAGQWNRLEVTCKGTKLRARLNGQLIHDLDLSLWSTPHKNPDGSDNKFSRAYATMVQAGHIGIQDHGGRVWLRNVKLRDLSPRKPSR